MSTRSAVPSHDPDSLSFGARLRQERERRKISIASIAENTKILGALLDGLEHDDVSRWPTGLYRRAFIRAYASAIGLNPEVVVKEFQEKFPEPEDVPVPPPAVVTAPAPPATGARSSAPSTAGWFADGALVPGLLLRFFAAGVDLFVLSVMGVVLYAVLGVFWAPLCLATGAYYAGSILLLGNTPGVCLFADPQRRRGRYLTLLRPSARDVADSAA